MCVGMSKNLNCESIYFAEKLSVCLSICDKCNKAFLVSFYIFILLFIAIYLVLVFLFGEKGVKRFIIDVQMFISCLRDFFYHWQESNLNHSCASVWEALYSNAISIRIVAKGNIVKLFVCVF